MPRVQREPSPSGFFHLTSRALRPLSLFADVDDYMLFLHALARVHTEDGLRIHSYCLMGTHFHLVVRAEPDVLTRSMRRLKGWYAHELNAKRDRVGPVFDGRYAAHAVKSETHVYTAVVYVALNPVRAGITQHPDEWLYGSHRAHAGLATRPEWLAPLSELELFANEQEHRATIDLAVELLRCEKAGLALGQTFWSDPPVGNIGRESGLAGRPDPKTPARGTSA